MGLTVDGATDSGAASMPFGSGELFSHGVSATPFMTTQEYTLPQRSTSHEWAQSPRNASIGSSAAARRAGHKPNATPIPMLTPNAISNAGPETAIGMSNACARR